MRILRRKRVNFLVCAQFCLLNVTEYSQSKYNWSPLKNTKHFRLRYFNKFSNHYHSLKSPICTQYVYSTFLPITSGIFYRIFLTGFTCISTSARQIRQFGGYSHQIMLFLDLDMRDGGKVSHNKLSTLSSADFHIYIILHDGP